MPYGTIRYELSENGVATIGLDQPETRNALSESSLGELLDALDSSREDDAVRCVVLASTHEKVFSSGANLAGFAADYRSCANTSARSAFRGYSARSASSASHRSAPREGTCSPGRLGWRSRATW